MSTNLTQSQTSNKQVTRKSGRTLVVKISDSNFDKKIFQSLEGLIDNQTTRSGAIFLVFNKEEASINALNTLKTFNSVDVKYAHYKIFFKLDGLTEGSDYDQVKALHTQWISDNADGKVLYYKLYRKEGTFLNCGDLTVDTKGTLDLLLSPTEHKNFELNDTFKGTFYRYNRKPSTK